MTRPLPSWQIVYLQVLLWFLYVVSSKMIGWVFGELTLVPLK